MNMRHLSQMLASQSTADRTVASTYFFYFAL